MFYQFRQNNSGGSFYFDESQGISVNVIIEADNAQEANEIAKDKGLYFDGYGDCPCCGNRWYETFEEDGNEVPSVYNTPIVEGMCSMKHAINWVGDNPDGFIHYKGGNIEPFYLVEK